MSATNEQLEEILIDLRDAEPGGLQQREVIAIMGSDGRQPKDRLTKAQTIEALHTLKVRRLVTSNISRLRARKEMPFRAPLQNEDMRGPNLVIFRLTQEGKQFLVDNDLV